MRSGLIPNAHATVEDAAESHYGQVPGGQRLLRDHLRRQAELLDLIAEAAKQGDTYTVLYQAARLAKHRDAASRIQNREPEVDVLDFDTTAA